ncbi:MAG: hypothetical protein WA858_15300, partial [Xanthobacteraceae bacterium]
MLRAVEAGRNNRANVRLPPKTVLDLHVNLVQPQLRSLRILLINFNLSLPFRDPIFGGAELVGKLLRHLK